MLMQELVISSVVLPLLQHIAVLHSHGLGHHHLSPWHVFIPSEHARCLTCTLPCPAAHPDEVNKLLADAVPVEYFAPEMWVCSIAFMCILWPRAQLHPRIAQWTVQQ